jgi:hypothetical protein
LTTIKEWLLLNIGCRSRKKPRRTEDDKSHLIKEEDCGKELKMRRASSRGLKCVYNRGRECEKVGRLEPCLLSLVRRKKDVGNGPGK